MAARYRSFLRLCQEWPVDASKDSLDLCRYIRTRVAQSFEKGDLTTIQDPKKCDEMYESLNKIRTNYHKNKYTLAKPYTTGTLGMTAEQCSIFLHEEFSKITKEKEGEEKGIFSRLRLSKDEK